MKLETLQQIGHEIVLFCHPHSLNWELAEIQQCPGSLLSRPVNGLPCGVARLIGFCFAHPNLLPVPGCRSRPLALEWPATGHFGGLAPDGKQREKIEIGALLRLVMVIASQYDGTSFWPLRANK